MDGSDTKRDSERMEIIMSGALTRFRIDALHNRYTVDVPIRDNKLILVGENGTGKSTVANFIYLFLTKQWSRIPTTYDFQSLTAVIDAEEIEIKKEELILAHQLSPLYRDSLLRKLSPLARQRFLNLIADIAPRELLGNPVNIEKYARQYNIPTRFLLEYAESKMLTEAESLSEEKIERITASINKLINGKVLYLPTYRRIEQELASIFSELEELPELKRTFERLRHRTYNENYVELVEFGMKDVEETISHKMGDLKNGFLASYNSLASTYLNEVISGKYLRSTELSEISELNESTINAVFNRIGQSMHSGQEQKLLRSYIEGIKNKTPDDSHTKVVLHYFKKLVELHNNQEEKEKEVREFVNVCNQYLSGKNFIFDKRNFNMVIQLQNPQHSSISDDGPNDENANLLDMSKLSSGEKQIVSLFSQIFLSGGSNYFVIIDEPELSLSVIWQKRFLPDILNSHRCSGLIAVTHSPYIFDNELDGYTHSIESFRESVNVTSGRP